MSGTSGDEPEARVSPAAPEDAVRPRDGAPDSFRSDGADGAKSPAHAGEGHGQRGESAEAFQAHVRAARHEFEAQFANARDQFEEANARIKQRTGRDLIVAIGIALAIGAAVLASLLVLKWVFAVFALTVVLLAVFEFGRALHASGHRFDVVPQVAGSVVLVATGFLLPEWLLLVTLFAVVAIVVVWRLVAQMAAADGRTYGDVLSDVLVSGFVQLYIPFMGALAVVLLRQDGGELWVLAFLLVTVAADTGAYATGLAIGRHPMAPRVSPKKTWEGFGGAFAAALVAGALLAWLMLGLPWWSGLIFGAVILATATIGDLGESMVKRDLGIKDMSSWLPGHGGVLDRLDSILPSAPAALALFFFLSPLGAA